MSILLDVKKLLAETGNKPRVSIEMEALCVVIDRRLKAQQESFVKLVQEQAVKSDNTNL